MHFIPSKLVNTQNVPSFSYFIFSNYYKELLYSQKWNSEILIFSFRSRGTLFCKGILWLEDQDLVHWRRHHQDARVSSWYHFRGLRKKGFPTDNRQSHGHKLCHSPNRHILYSYEAKFIQSLFSTRRKRLASQFNFTYIDTSMTHCPLTTLTLKII